VLRLLKNCGLWKALVDGIFIIDRQMTAEKSIAQNNK
jgi:hypothetical protein